MPRLNQKYPSDEEMGLFLKKYIRICKIIIFIMALMIISFAMMFYYLISSESYPFKLWGIMLMGLGILGLRIVPDKKDHITAKVYVNKLNEKYNAH